MSLGAPGGGTYDLDGETVTFTLNGTPTVIPITAADLNAVTPAELRASIAAAMAGASAGTRQPTASSTMRHVCPTSVATTALPEAMASSRLELPRFS